MRKIFLLSLFVVSTLQAGEPAFQFLRVGVTARATALGDAFTSRFGDVNTVLYNPASVAFLDSRQVTASYMDHLLDIGSGYIGYAQPWADYGVFGSGIVYFNYGDFNGLDVNGHPTGTFGAADFSWNFFYAHHLNDQIGYGITMKYIRSAIQEYSASAVAMDLGVIYRYDPLLMQAGFAVLNLGTPTSSFIHTREKLPLRVQFGVSKKLEKAPVTLSANLVQVNGGSAGDALNNFSLGAEINPRENLYLRFGYDNQRHRDLSISDDGFMERAAGFSAGFGYTYTHYTIDYSFASWGIGSVNRFSFTYNF